MARLIIITAILFATACTASAETPEPRGDMPYSVRVDGIARDGAPPEPTATPTFAHQQGVGGIARDGELPTATPIPPTAVPTLEAPTATLEAPAPNLGGSGIDAWLAASPWPAELWPAVKAVGMCESGLRPGVDSPGGANRGLMQVNRVHIGGKIAARGYTWADMLDPVRNLEVAWDIYSDSGWGPWSCRYVLN